MAHLKARPILRANGLYKSFKERLALKDVSFDVYEGEIFCLLGPNGAGKSTTINILSTALQADRGEVFFHGARADASNRRYRGALGIVPQDLAIYEEISAKANVTFFASLYGLRGEQLRDNVQRALEFVGLVDRQNDKPSTFSGGMKRRLNIACAIAHNPEIIIMDEPTVGIDPQSRTHILESIKALKDAGSTIIYTTHYMEEVEAISTRIVIIDHGEIIAEGTKEQLKESLEDGRIYTIEIDQAEQAEQVEQIDRGAESEGLHSSPPAGEPADAAGAPTSAPATTDPATDRRIPVGANGVVDELYAIQGVKRVDWTDGGIEIATTPGIENLEKIIATLLNTGCKIRNLTTSVASLETVFLHLTGRSLRN